MELMRLGFLGFIRSRIFWMIKLIKKPWKIKMINYHKMIKLQIMVLRL